MSGVLRWEEPPEPSPRGNAYNPRVADWYRIAAQLRDRRGQWAAVADNAAAYAATAIRQGVYKAFVPAGSFEAKAVRVDNVLTIYARYIGEES